MTSTISSNLPGGAKLIGEQGWIYASRENEAASNPAWLDPAFEAGPKKAYASRDHTGNFLECIRTRKECIAPAEVAHRSITPGHLAFVSQELQRKLTWDPAAETVVGDEAADQLLKAVNYRAPWVLGA